VQTLQCKLANLKDATANQNPTQPPTASTSKQRSPLTQQPLAPAPARYTRPSPSTLAATSASPSRSRAISGPSTLLGRKTPENENASSSVFRAKTFEPARAPASRTQDPVPITTVAGKKRAAPDGGDEAAPVQGFTSDGVLAAERSAAMTTPRRRKNPRTGLHSCSKQHISPRDDACADRTSTRDASCHF
jgi:hypothetical protein